MSDADRMAAADGLSKVDGIDLLLVQPDSATYRMAYDVVANSTLWFCHHHLFDLRAGPGSIGPGPRRGSTTGS